MCRKPDGIFHSLWGKIHPMGLKHFRTIYEKAFIQFSNFQDQTPIERRVKFRRRSAIVKGWLVEERIRGCQPLPFVQVWSVHFPPHRSPGWGVCVFNGLLALTRKLNLPPHPLRVKGYVKRLHGEELGVDFRSSRDQPFSSRWNKERKKEKSSTDFCHPHGFALKYGTVVVFQCSSTFPNWNRNPCFAFWSRPFLLYTSWIKKAKEAWDKVTWPQYSLPSQEGLTKRARMGNRNCPYSHALTSKGYSAKIWTLFFPTANIWQPYGRVGWK